MFTNDELTTIAGQLRTNANATLRRYPEHTFAERLLRIAVKAEDAIIDNTPIERADDLADYVSFIDSRNLIRLKEESRDKYIAQRDASAKNRHETALKYDYPDVHERLYAD
jgi:hypothetical protein